jgi:surface antigen
MYIEGNVSTLDVLASENSISEVVKRQDDRSQVSRVVSNATEQIKKMKAQLEVDKQTVEKLITDDKAMQVEVTAQRAAQQSLLDQTKGQEAAYQNMIQGKQSEIASLRAQQRAANLAHGGAATPGDPNHGGYPAAWDNSPQDSLIDSWGMYNRECVSYTAWRVYSSGRYMPYWGGVGNASQWPGNARAAGIPVDGSPRVGDVAIAYWGPYGHAMYVEAVGNGQVYVSQYNYYIDGRYSEMWVSTAGLQFIHF